MTRTIVLSLAAVGLWSSLAGASVLLVPFQYADVPSAIAAAQSGDTIRVELVASGFTPGQYGYNFGRGVDFAGRALQLDFNGTTSFQLDRTAVFTLANSSSIQFDNAVTWSGNLVVPAGATASISTTSSFSVPQQEIAQFAIGPGATFTLSAGNLTSLNGTFHVARDASLFLQASSTTTGSGATFIGEAGSTLSFPSTFTLNGYLTSIGGGVQSGVAFTANNSITTVIGGSWIGTTVRVSGSLSTLNLSNCTVVARTLEVLSAARLSGSGQWFADVTVNAGTQATFLADTTVVGTFRNSGRTVVQGGTLVVAGSLINSGQLVGDVVSASGMGAPGLVVGGDFSANTGSDLAFRNGLLRITGNADFDLFNGLDVDLESATLHVGAPGGASTLEVIGRNVGPSLAGFTRSVSGYPIGTLIIEGHVQLTDAHSGGDALYVRDLRIPAGARLTTNGHRIYYRTLANAGVVESPADLVPVPDCVADFDGSGVVSVQDVFAFLNAYFAGGASADVNHDGVVSLPDIFDFLAAYFAGCE
jgi:hypothetical protein